MKGVQKKSMKVTNRNQFELLVSEMERNPSVARGLGKSGSNKVDNKGFWSSLEMKLNSLGPPTRDAAGWLKVWNDQKYAVKQKMRKNKREMRATGGGPNSTCILDSYKETIANILQLDTAMRPSGTPLSVSVEDDDEIESLISEEENCTSSDATQMSSTPRTFNQRNRNTKEQKEDQRMHMIKKHTYIQNGILKANQEAVKYMRRIAKAKEEELQILKEEIKNKRSFRAKVLELKKQKVQALLNKNKIKSRLLDLE